MKIFLIGPMAAGKTAVGHRLATLLKLRFFDTDALLQQEQGQTMVEIFNQNGEAYFRRLEGDLLAKITCQPNIVLATGGGSILSLQSRNYLRCRGLVCYLRVGMEQQLTRLQNDNTRPTLIGQQRVKLLHKMQLQRQLFYKSIANISIDTDNKSPEHLAQQLASLIE